MFDGVVGIAPGGLKRDPLLKASWSHLGEKMATPTMGAQLMFMGDGHTYSGHTAVAPPLFQDLSYLHGVTLSRLSSFIT